MYHPEAKPTAETMLSPANDALALESKLLRERQNPNI